MVEMFDVLITLYELTIFSESRSSVYRRVSKIGLEHSIGLKLYVSSYYNGRA